ncbi:hypothetical protein [Streptomyces melanogenes]|uniref:Uncharacterized protein n=1 Tax=Streptomyces melanogenes TaxID=67326 RepID=A0ABZ1XB71_9ACTN|nr:hypothetical protein [Streptomyces melanogenes]
MDHPGGVYGQPATIAAHANQGIQVFLCSCPGQQPPSARTR